MSNTLMPQLEISSVNRVRSEDDGSPDSMPTFEVVGTFNGKPIALHVSLDLDGRDAEILSPGGGYNPDQDPAVDPVDLQEALFEFIYETDAYQEAVQEFQS